MPHVRAAGILNPAGPCSAQVLSTHRAGVSVRASLENLGTAGAVLLVLLLLVMVGQG